MTTLRTAAALALAVSLAPAAHAAGFDAHKAKELEGRIQTAKQKLSVAHRMDNSAHIYEAKAGALVFGVHVGVGLETRNGRTSLVAMGGASLDRSGIGAHVGASNVRYRTFDPGVRALHGLETREPFKADSESLGASGKDDVFGWSYARPTGDTIGAVEGKTYQLGVEKRILNVDVMTVRRVQLPVRAPLSWPSKRMREIKKSLTEADRALAQIATARHHGGAELLEHATRRVEAIEKVAAAE